MSRPIVVIVCMDAPPNRGSFNSTHIHGTHVPVEEPSTASNSEVATTRPPSSNWSSGRSYLRNGDAGGREQPADNQLWGHTSPRNNTLEIKANMGSSRPNGATRPMEQRAISQNQRPNPTIPP